MAGEGEYGRNETRDHGNLFPHERVVFFSDAVFAIAMTLLAIETRVTGKLVWYSILQLMFVALMPFATRMCSDAFSSQDEDRFAFYAFVLASIAFFAWLTRRQAVKQETCVKARCARNPLVPDARAGFVVRVRRVHSAGLRAAGVDRRFHLLVDRAVVGDRAACVLPFRETESAA